MEIKWYQLLFQIINFGILMWLLNRFLYRPIMRIIDQRNKKIEDSIKAAEETLKEKEKIAMLKKQAVDEAEKEAVAIIEQARKLGDKTGKQLIVQAQQEAEAAVDKKMQLVNEAMNQQEKELTKKISDLVITTTRQVLKSSLNDQEQRKIIDRQIKELGKVK
jgi:F-type H+-transporting ATPase subunit b